MTSRKQYRSIDGLVLLNKPQGISSNKALQQIKHLFRAKKAGHTGSLDPLATGMLPICFGEATKVSQFLLNADKSYTAEGKLGITTDTSDSTGTILESCPSFDVSEARLREVLQHFIGEVEQTPSMYSALKYQGQPLYRYARKGETVPQKTRKIHIHTLDLLDFDGGTFRIEVLCSKGTYIRNLIEDIGVALGVGAHMTSLHRNYTAGFAAWPMYPVDTLQSASDTELMAKLLPTDEAVKWMPLLSLSAEQTTFIIQGQEVAIEGLVEGTLYRLYNETDRFLGIGLAVESGKLRAKRLVAQQLPA